MNVRKISLIALTLLAVLALVGAVSAQENPTPQPTQQWQQDRGGQNDPNWQGNQGQNDPSCNNGQDNQGRCWQWNNGQGGNQGQNDPYCRYGQDNQNRCWQWNNNNNNNGYGRGNPRDYRGGRYGYPYPYWPYTYTPPQYVAPTVVAPTEADILNHVVQIVATALNLQPGDVTSQMTSMTLAQIIQAHNGDLNTITNQILAGLLDWIGGGINDNTIPAARANQILDNLQSIVQRALNGEYTQTGVTVTGLLNV